MKRSLLNLIASVMAVSVIFVSCGEDKNKKPVESSAPAQSEVVQDDAKSEEAPVAAAKEEVRPEVKEEKKEEPFPHQDVSGIKFPEYEINPFADASKEFSFQGSAGFKEFVNTVPEVFFLGWSKDGKVAFGENVFMDGIGETRSYYYVQDTVTDKILYNSSTSDASFEDKVNEYKIYIQKPVYVAPSTNNGDGPDGGAVWFVINGENNRYDEDGFVILDYECVAKTKKSSKVVSSQKDAHCNDVYVCGYVKSPFENRVALFLAKTVRGFEGLDVNYEIVGCSMDVGF